jgi:hypothetical protein
VVINPCVAFFKKSALSYPDKCPENSEIPARLQWNSYARGAVLLGIQERLQEALICLRKQGLNKNGNGRNSEIKED